MSNNPFLPLLPPSYPGDDWNVPLPPMAPPDISKEMIPATAPSNAVLPDEAAGNWTAYPYSTTPTPELTYNPYPAPVYSPNGKLP